MNNLLDNIRKEWEKSILIGLLVILAALCAVVAYRYLHQEDEVEEIPKAKTELPCFFDTALLQLKYETNNTVNGNPLACVFQKPEPPKPKPNTTPTPNPQTPPKNPGKTTTTAQKDTTPTNTTTPPKTPDTKTTTPQTATTKPAPNPTKTETKTNTPPPAPPKQPAPKKYRKFDLVYIGNMSIDNQEAVAQLHITETLPNSKKSSMLIRLTQNQHFVDGLMTVESFDQHAAVISHSNGQKLSVPIGAAPQHLEIEIK